MLAKEGHGAYLRGYATKVAHTWHHSWLQAYADACSVLYPQELHAPTHTCGVPSHNGPAMQDTELEQRDCLDSSRHGASLAPHQLTLQSN
jgi:hypothetical protein